VGIVHKTEDAKGFREVLRAGLKKFLCNKSLLFASKVAIGSVKGKVVIISARRRAVRGSEQQTGLAV
jgi:hypothetical protein